MFSFTCNGSKAEQVLQPSHNKKLQSFGPNHWFYPPKVFIVKKQLQESCWESLCWQSTAVKWIRKQRGSYLPDEKVRSGGWVGGWGCRVCAERMWEWSEIPNMTPDPWAPAGRLKHNTKRKVSPSKLLVMISLAFARSGSSRVEEKRAKKAAEEEIPRRPELNYCPFRHQSFHLANYSKICLFFSLWMELHFFVILYFFMFFFFF